MSDFPDGFGLDDRDTMRNKGLIAAAELERRKREIVEHLDHLADERRALTEVRDLLAEEVSGLAARLAAATQARDDLAAKIDAETKRQLEMNEEIDALGREARILERRSADNQGRDKELAKKIKAIQEELAGARSDISEVSDALETGREVLARMPLGIVPVEEDGSAYFEAPVNKAILFQTVDESGQAIQTMRSLTYVHPGEYLSCIGCHEDK